MIAMYRRIVGGISFTTSLIVIFQLFQPNIYDKGHVGEVHEHI